MSALQEAHAPQGNEIRVTLTFAHAIVFVSSFCLMTIELLASRVMAPYLGVSLYTWTGIIGIILLGISAGNYAGGFLADRTVSHKRLGLCMGLAGCCVLLAIVLAPLVGPRLTYASLPLPLVTVLFSLFIFFPPAFFLSTVFPQVIKFDLHDLEQTGATIGTISAWSAIGSIVGTFAAGFFFFMYVGTHRLLISVALFLFVLGLFVARQKRFFHSV